MGWLIGAAIVGGAAFWIFGGRGGRSEASLRAELARLAGGPEAADRLAAGVKRRYPQATDAQCYRRAIDELRLDRR